MEKAMRRRKIGCHFAIFQERIREHLGPTLSPMSNYKLLEDAKKWSIWS